jgi:hypothetical protein
MRTSTCVLKDVNGVEMEDASAAGVAVTAQSDPSGRSPVRGGGPSASARKSMAVAVETPPAGMTRVRMPSLDVTAPPCGPTTCTAAGGGGGEPDGVGAGAGRRCDRFARADADADAEVDADADARGGGADELVVPAGVGCCDDFVGFGAGE